MPIQPRLNCMMRTLRARLSVLALGLILLVAARLSAREIPDALKPWEGWATWNDEHRYCPTPYSDPAKHLCFWPSRLGLQADRTGGKFDVVVTTYHATWVPLPGDADVWPLEVKANSTPIAVLDREGKPAVYLQPGTFRLEGAYRWSEVPQRLCIPAEIGILALVIDGQKVESPVWDAQGFLWLKRDGSKEEADKNFLAVKLYAALEDGIPLWLRTEVELTVSGQSREEDIGTILPEGWKLASVENPIPVLIENGRMKAQVRAGKWTVRAIAFRFDNPKEFRFAEGAKPAVTEELLAYKARPDLRVAEISGAPSIDVSQTTFPAQWRDLPVYRWETNAVLRFEERMRGMGDQKPAGLALTREWWLDESGRALTFRDWLRGQRQQTWRLDAAEGQDLGSVRSRGQGQLITRNPQTQAPGVEIRQRDLELEATGRMARNGSLSATGWRTDADSVQVTLNLPPGWRLFALFGADWVRGDWLTAWTLLDLFVVLVFTLAIFRLWGLPTALLALAAFVLSYREPGAPRYLWLALLVPLALQRVVPAGWGQRLVALGKWVVIVIFLFTLVPFSVRQVQQALYPQLERVRDGGYGPSRDSVYAPSQASAEGVVMAEAPMPAPQEQEATAESTPRSRVANVWGDSEYSRKPMKKELSKDNLLYDAKARIQTGPGVPEWRWRQVQFGWNGPVQAAQQVRPVLISVTLERVLSVLRVGLLLVLAAVLLGVRRWGGGTLAAGGKAAAAALMLFGLLTGAATAQSTIPDQATLDQLRERLLKASDAFPHAADLPSVTLKLAGNKLTLDAEIHAAVKTAVPLPGRLPAWSPVTVLVDDKPEVSLRRDDGYLWIVVPEGVHRVHVEGSLAGATEWEWTFLLKPRQVKIEAPDWTFSGVRADGVPEAQVFFTQKQKVEAGQASYDRQEVQSIVLVERNVELGLIWQVRTTVQRWSPPGKAIALRVPLLPGENVLSANAVVREGAIEVRLGAQETSYSWESSLATGTQLALATRPTDTWIERWRLVASPVWNVSLAGLPPIFEPTGADLVPVWQPWPGEKVDLTLSRPEAIAGATVTISRGTHEITVGKRQRTSKLDLALRCSLGEDFLIGLPAEAEITSLTQNGQTIPVRKDGANLIVPLRPGEQAISVAWKINTPLGSRTQAEAVRLPVESANVNTIIHVPESRWVLATGGPLLGPAVRFWVILIVALLTAFVLGRLALSPLRVLEWMLLVIGLTQVPLAAALIVVAWLFFLAWRGRDDFQKIGPTGYNLLQVVLIGTTFVSLGILMVAVGEGLLGAPQMFITGNNSSATALRWFQARTELTLPQPGFASISIWWYRLLMLGWALWLAASVIRWLRLGWQHFSRGGCFRTTPKPEAKPPALPVREGKA